MNKATNSKIITNVISIRNKEINERQVKMIRDLDDMGLLVTPSFNLKCSPSAYFQPRNN
ncbi:MULTISPECIES: hypothetical protein [Enterobacterales]|jgi:hypothetical protein|uniref:hypothetical protein n=1 Tax=Enterobacterales TaxID=91347 RepID=UPI00131BA351|nr:MULTISPECIES: hypothetical protein [Enterobacterales]EKU0925067.1 hypothetical protein [Proteus mirabilis]EKU8091034.1 hypothetical protein [Proteus mirabilis]EKV7661549.1 hypothetical protein [Proteus mirabilis]EKX3823244.1 hypothetical protein [Proteus mirabilis]EKX3826779.1 hypothetical protein [Proteus mirabilis]